MSIDDSITTTKLSGSKGTAAWANAVQTALGGGHPQLSSDWIVYYDVTDALYRARNGDDGSVDSENALFQTVFSDVMGLAAAGEVITFKGNNNVAEECNITKGVILNNYGAKFTWTGAHDVEHSMFKATPVVDSVRILGGKYLVNHKDVWPLGTLTLTNSLIKDITVNHTIRSASLHNVTFQNITQLGEYGAQGYDYGINLVGHEITVDGFYGDLATEYHGGFVINGSDAEIPDNITIRNVYVKGLFGGFVNWYYPRKAVTQFVGGRCTVENFHWELEGIPKWGNFAPFLMFDTEGITEAISADYGTIIIQNGEIIGPSLTLVGSVNGISVKSLCWLWYEGTDATVDITFKDIRITGMRGTDATNDYMTMCLGGRCLLDNVSYVGAWNLNIAYNFTNLVLHIINCDFNVAANALSINSDDSGISYISLTGNEFSDTVGINETAGHTMHIGQSDNILPVHADSVLAINTGAPTRYDARDIVPSADNIFYLGRWVPKQQWLGLYLSSDGYVIWENDAKIWRHAANVLAFDASLYPSNGTLDLGKDEDVHRWGQLHLGTGVWVAGNQVVAAQQAAIGSLGTGGADEDGTCRAKMNSILAVLRAHGLIDT